MKRTLLFLSVLVAACPATGPVTIPCRSNAQCPTGYGCTLDGVCETGSGYLTTTELRIDDVRLDTHYASATQLTATIPAAQLVTGRSATVTAVTPGLGGTSAGASFLINNPQAMLGAISPSTALAGA